jgi:phage terminase small subunit
MAENLNDKQKLFVHEYLLDGNATRAAISAGYSKDSARSIGSELLTNPYISEAIAKRFNKRCQRLELTADRVLQELCKLAFYDPRNFYNQDGSLKHPTELDDNTAMALAGMDIEEAYEHFGKGQAKPTGVIKKIKLADKGQNLERLGKTFKLFTDKIEVGADKSLASAIAEARKRAAKRNG